MDKEITGFSKLTKNQKIEWIANQYFANRNEAVDLIKKYWNNDLKLQQLHDEFIENTITNFYLPLGVVPNVLINEHFYTVPMVIEESSVVAAASKAAKFWSTRGGFKTTVLGTQKIGQVHFNFSGGTEKLKTYFNYILPFLYEETHSITKNMVNRGGGISSIQLVDKTSVLPNYYQLHATFETKDSMGANFINTCLEQFAKTLVSHAPNFDLFDASDKEIEVVMSILSNYVTHCLVRAEVSCPVDQLLDKGISNPEDFAKKFIRAVQIAEVEPYRAVTHNKGIMNGVDAVVLATGNDFRAVEAAIHAYASKDGQYKSLSHATMEDGIFKFWLELPLALGTVGGLTSLHPMVKLSLEMLENPDASKLMQIVATLGLAQNFAALRSLTTSGIQVGHMKMHLNNMLNQYQATQEERVLVMQHFTNQTISHSLVIEFLEKIRKNGEKAIL